MQRKRYKALFIAVPLALLWVLPAYAAKEEQPEKVDVAQNLYSADPQPLTPVQCGQCHPAIYQQIKHDGKRHRFECMKCHQQLHAYNPIRKNWSEIMPQCSSCHDLPHGKTFTDCLKCHSNPHTPLTIPSDNLADSCGTCHTGPMAELTKFPSSHTEQGCATCHTSHGLIPSCMECHETHVTGQKLESCMACHPVHKPLEVVYDASQSSTATCGSCHEGVYGEWSGTASKHGEVTCAACHNKHGLIPDCQKCHEAPHDAKLLKKFPICLDCHINVHDLPIKRK
jgi:hypothetical protein